MADPFSLAITVALNAATMAMTMMQKIEGPRLSDLSVTTADYGTPLANMYGTKRLECPCFYAEEIREEKNKSKGKGGKYEEYRYYGTFAVIVADHEIRNVLRIWMDRQLAFDYTTTTRPRSPLGPKFSRYVRIYLGTEDQEPDPRMVATVEGEEGPDTCPAYLGVAYIMFEEMPLDKFGNRLPQVSAQAVRGPPQAQYPYATENADLNMFNVNFTPNRKRMIMVDDGEFNVWDLPTRTLVVNWSSDIEFTQYGHGPTDEGGTYAMSGFVTPSLWYISPYGGATELIAPSGFPTGDDLFHEGVAYVGGQVCLYPYGLLQSQGGYLAADEVLTLDLTWIPSHFFEDDEGNAWACGGGTNRLHFCRFPSGADEFDVVVTTDDHACAWDTGDGTFMAWQDGFLHLVDKETGALLDSQSTYAFPGDFYEARNHFNAFRPGDGAFWISDHTRARKHSLTDLSVEVTTSTLTTWKNEDTDAAIYDPMNHAIISHPQFDAVLTWRFLERDGETAYALGDICADVAELAGMDTAEFDFTDLDQDVEGYVWSQGAAKDIISALLDIHDSDIVPRGFQLVGQKRGRPLDGEPISSNWLVASDGDSPLYRLTMTSDSNLPRRVFCTFADPNMEEQPNTAVAQRNATSVMTEREVSFDLSTMRAEPDAIQPMLERALRRRWVGATQLECSLSPLDLRVEPGDVRHFILDDEVLRMRALTTTIKANRVLDTRWEVDGETPVVLADWESDDVSPLNAVFNSPGGLTQGRPASEVFFPQDTIGFALDIPLVADEDEQDTPFIYLAASPEFDGGFWPGAGVWQSDNNEEDSFVAGFDSFASDDGATWGIVQGDGLGDALSSVIDEASSLVVYLPAGGELVSVSEDELLADGTLNVALVGGEIIQFRDADLTATNRYTLTGLVRGHRGTEWATGDHEVGERFLLLSGVKKHTIGASEIGDEDFYKFSTFGDELDTAATHAVDFTAAAHKPYAPAHVTLTLEADTDWRIDWMRRTRIGGSTVAGQDVPLGETSESYVVRIMDGDDVVRTITATDATATYTAAQQTADWGGVQSTLAVEVAQVAPDLNLEGFVTEASA